MNEAESLPPQKTMRPLTEMRWEQRSMGNTCFNGQYVPPLLVLQQAWAPVGGGQVEWRDVPTVLAAAIRSAK